MPSDSPGAPRTSSTGRKLPLKVRVCGREEKGSGGQEESTEGGQRGEGQRAPFKPDLPEGSPTAAALKFNMRRQTLSAAPSSTSPRLARKQEREAAAGEGGGYYTDTPSDKTGGCAPVDIFVTSGQSRILPESAHTVDFKMEAQCVDKSSSLEVVINSKNTVKPGAI